MNLIFMDWSPAVIGATLSVSAHLLNVRIVFP